MSEDDLRRQRFAHAAREAGWEPLECGSVGEAMRVHERQRTQLAMIDFGVMPAASQSAFRQFASMLASSERLLLISDEPADTSAGNELWAREVGAWMYLASPEFDEGLAELLAQAREIAQKLGESPAVAAR